ncbi:MAG: hypothetical protein K5908_00470 [Erysipelotrichaceae bacterium]|jgi:hypothetical protein|nr:hypothetical protein [Erysipelotrichaceae bacterium]
MLTDNMPLRKMLDFAPSDMDMAMLPLDVVVYVKFSIVSQSNEDNYAFIRYLFSAPELSEYFKDLRDTIFYDFDGRSTVQRRFVTIFEMYSLYNYANISEYLKEILEFYSHEADVLIDLYTHDSKAYRLSNLDGIVKLEEMTKEKSVS